MKIEFLQNTILTKHSDNSSKPHISKKSYKTSNISIRNFGVDANGYYNRITFQGRINKSDNIRHKPDNYEGCLIGGAIGDALGAPVEFMPLYAIKREYGQNGIKKLLTKEKQKAEFTDDTQMTIFTADGLIKSALKNHSINNINFYDVFESYGDWLSTQRNKRVHKGWLSDIKELYKVKAPGNTCISAIMGGEPGTIDKKINDSKGNGGTMRVAPVGLMYYNNPSRAFNIAVGCCALTHSRPEAYLSAGAMAAIIAYIIKGETPDDAVEKTLKILERKNNNEKVTNLLKKASFYSKTNLFPEEVIPQLGNGWTGEEALAIAVYSALKYSDNFKKAVECAVNITGDSDTVGSMTGNIVGAYLGAKNIPAEFKDKIAAKNILIDLAHDLYVGPNRIKNKAQKYPIPEKYSESLSLNKLLGHNYKLTKSIENKEFLKYLKNIPYKNISNYREFLHNKDLPANTIKQMMRPIEMIAREIDNNVFFNKMIYTLANNHERLAAVENNRGLWREDKVYSYELMWQILGYIIDNPSESDNLFKTITVMIKSGKYSLKDMSDFLIIADKGKIDFNAVFKALSSGARFEDLKRRIM